ncbi:MAG: PTS sugar transporter subunit IIA [candidate division Zixibacteria bacterium]|nr:PTS sugar transporter subunit IIA [candidate division Zixibacteria bacterium]
MNLARYITEDLVKLEMETIVEPYIEDSSREKWLQRSKESILAELVGLLNFGAKIGNQNKLLTDFINRERKASTAIGYGVAVPHIRSLQAKDFIIGFARSTPGYDFDAPDKELTHLFFVMAAPPYDDSLYLKAFKALTTLVAREDIRQELRDVTNTGEVIRALRG